MSLEKARGGRRTAGGLLLAAASVPIIAYFAFFFSYVLNVPFGDDYAVLAYAINSSNPEWPGKTALFFSQHNEHRIVTLRAVVHALRALSLKIDWALIAFLGNLGIVAVFLLLGKHAIGGREGPLWGKILYFLPVSFLLFQPQHHELTLWAMCAFTNVLVVVFAFLSFRFLSDRFALAVVFAFLAAFTNGNGVLVFFVGAVVLLLARKFKRAAIWTGAGGVALGLYFAGYVHNPAMPAALPFLKAQPLEAARYFLSVLGSFADFGILRPFATIVTGGVLLAVFCDLVVKRLDRKSPFLFSATLFVLLSLTSVAWARAPFGLALSYSSRYKFLSVLAVLLIYLGSCCIVRRRRAVTAVGLGISLAFCAASFIVNMPHGRSTKMVRIVNLIDWNRGKADLPYPNKEHADDIMRLAVQRKIYEPPRRWGIERPKYPFGAVTASVPGVGAADGSGRVRVSGWALDNAGPPRIIVRRAVLPAEGTRAGLTYVGQTSCVEGTIPDIARVYYGFPGRDRMVWNLDYAPEDPPGSSPPEALYFFAHDRAGHETQIGTYFFNGEIPPHPPLGKGGVVQTLSLREIPPHPPLEKGGVERPISPPFFKGGSGGISNDN